ncbi:MAG TPA: TlpA disulfide reductase family protein [Candidatus Limnocylindria bacterium]|nr:TlpA disulfide reductase family protein [Candidatus Limnocylindria bacterium]
MTSRRSRGMPRRTSQPANQGHRNRWILIGGAIGVVALAAVVAFVLTAAPGGPAEPAEAPLVITGLPLPDLPAEGADPALGSTVPILAGTAISGQPMEIGPRGGAQMIVVLAHWCPHCQAELPLLVDLIDAGEIPDGVSVVGLATGIDELRPNYPPSAWFEREGWQQPTLIDDAGSSGLQALGLGVFPGFVFVDAQGRVTQRMTGEVDPQVLIQAMQAAAQG